MNQKNSQQKNTIEMSGKFDGKRPGDTLFWAFEQGILWVYGEGAMPDYAGKQTAPWDALKEQITVVVAEEGVTEIGAKAFAGCEQLQALLLPESLRRIGYAAFWGCKKLQKADLPETGKLVHIYEQLPAEPEYSRHTEQKGHVVIMGLHAFGQTIFAEEQWDGFYVKDGVLLDYLGMGEVAAVPAGVKEIGQFAFKDCPVKEVLLPQGLEKICMFAFERTKLEKLKLPDSIRRIERSAFSESSELSCMELPPMDGRRLKVDAWAFLGTKLHFRGRVSETLPELYEIVLVSERGIDGFRKLAVKKRKNQVGTATVNTGKSIIRRIQRQNIIIGIKYNEKTKKVINVKSFSWSDYAECPQEYLMYPFAEEEEEEKTAEIWDDSVTYMEKTDILDCFSRWFPYMEEDSILCAFSGTKPEHQDSRFTIRPTAEGIREEWYWSSDYGNFGGPLELKLLEKWWKKHPDLALPTQEEAREAAKYHWFVEC